MSYLQNTVVTQTQFGNRPRCRLEGDEWVADEIAGE